jgi:hypothetical protein
MDIQIVLPTNYIPYEKLVVCNNTLINGKVPITIGPFVPILVGKGDVPKIWLNMLLLRNQKEPSKTIVRENLALYDKILIKIIEKYVKISISGQPIVEVEKKSNNEAVIVFLDLRPIGTNILGDSEKLIIGDQIHSGKIFENVDSMYGINLI